MKETVLVIVLGALATGLRAGLKAYKKRGKLDASVIVEAAEAALGDAEEKK
jgi:hypothetical protein